MPLAKFAMLFSTVGCVGAWFEKKALLVIVIDPLARSYGDVVSFSH